MTSLEYIFYCCNCSHYHFPRFLWNSTAVPLDICIIINFLTSFPRLKKQCLYKPMLSVTLSVTNFELINRGVEISKIPSSYKISAIQSRPEVAWHRNQHVLLFLSWYIGNKRRRLRQPWGSWRYCGISDHRGYGAV